MTHQNALKVLIVVLALGLCAMVFYKPRIDNEFHNDYLENLHNFDTLPKQLTQDLLRIHVGLISHYDFVEADMQLIKKASMLSRFAPSFVSLEYQSKVSVLLETFNARYENLNEQVNLAKRYVGLVRNSGSSLNHFFDSIISDAKGNAQLLAGMHRLRELLDESASEEAVLLHIQNLSDLNTNLQSSFSILKTHAGMYSLYRPKLENIIENTNRLIGEIEEPGKLLTLYAQQQTITADRMDHFLWAANAIGGLLVIVSLLLFRTSLVARKLIEAKTVELEKKNISDRHAISICSDVLAGISRGDFSRRVEQNFEGELDILRLSVNSTADRVEKTMLELSSVMNLLAEGNFGVELDESVEGMFRASVDNMLISLNNTFSGITEVMENISNGDFSKRYSAPANGDLKRLKEAVNLSLSSLDLSLQEITTVVVSQKEGNLNPRVMQNYPGDLHTLSDAVNVSMEKIQSVLGDIVAVIDSVENASYEISQGNIGLNERALEAVGNFEKASGNILNMSEGLNNIALCVEKAENIAESTSNTAEQGKSVVADAVDAMEQITSSSRKIVDIISVIDEISFQTNLLALNASVEAARAGEQGRGFSVVASEVRILAGRSANAAREIKELIEDSAGKVDRGTHLVNESGETLSRIVDGVQDVVGVIEEISGVSRSQGVVMDQVADALGRLETTSRKNVQLAGMANTRTQESIVHINTLRETISFFGVGEVQAAQRRQVG